MDTRFREELGSFFFSQTSRKVRASSSAFFGFGPARSAMYGYAFTSSFTFR